MAIFSIGNFSVAGLNTDTNPTDINKDSLTRAENVRMQNGGITPFGGFMKVKALPIGAVPQYVYFVKSSAGDVWIIACKDAVYAFTTGFTNVSPTFMATVDNGDSWTAGAISGIPLLNHPIFGPMYMDAATNKFKSLPWNATDTWDSRNQSCNLLVVHKQYLFALGLLDNGSEKFDAVRWSAPADVGAVPLNWDPLDTTSPAGVTPLGGNCGRIIGALSMRDSLVVYREKGINVFDYVGGQYVWRIRQMQTTAGLLSKDAVVDVNGTHYFISDGDIFSNDGNTVRSIATDRIRTRLNTINKAQYKRCIAIHQFNKKEIWFCIPMAENLRPNIAYIYNYLYDSWTTRELPLIISAGIGSLKSDATTWDTSTETWDGSVKTWDDNSSTPFDTVLMSARQDGTGYELILLDYILGFNSQPYSSIIERTDLVIGGMDTAKIVTRIYPHVAGAGKMTIQLGSQQYAGGPVQWKAPVDYYPSKDRKVDIRSSGSLHAYRVMATDVDANFILTALDFEYEMAGKR